MEAEFMEQLDNMQTGADWGAALSKRLDCRFMKDEEFAATKVDELTAGFSNLCHLDCPFCEEHNSKARRIPLQEFSVDRLIQLIRDHHDRTGFRVGRFRIGNTGEPLAHERIIDLIAQTEDSVNHYSIYSSLSVDDEEVLHFITDHPKIDWIHLSCDAGDEKTYSRFKIDGDFDVMVRNARMLKRAGKRLTLNAVLFRENALSLLQLPEHLYHEGITELHIRYPLNPNALLNRSGLHKLTLSELREFLLKVRTMCEIYSIGLTTDVWAYRPELIGTLAALENDTLYQQYTVAPCERLNRLALYPDGSFNNCAVLNPMGLAQREGSRPMQDRGLLQMLNVPEALTVRRLQTLGYFPPTCRLLCGKVDNPRSSREAADLLHEQAKKAEESRDGNE